MRPWTIEQTQILHQLGQRIRLLEARVAGLEQRPDERWYSIRQMMVKHGVCRRTIYVWIHKGKFDIAYTPSDRPRLREKPRSVRVAV